MTVALDEQGRAVRPRAHADAAFLAGVRSPRQGRKPATWTPVDRDYEALRIDMQNLFQHLHLDTVSVAA